MVAGRAKRRAPNQAPARSPRVMKPSPAMLALVTDAYRGRGGIAQYNRDCFEALAEEGLLSITILPRQAPDSSGMPEAIEQLQARPGRIAYSVARNRSLVAAVADSAHGHGTGRPLIMCLALYARCRALLGRDSARSSPRRAEYREG